MTASSWTVEPGEEDALAAHLRKRLPGRSWGDVKKLLASGKVCLDGVTETSAGRRVLAGEVVSLDLQARRKAPRGEVAVVHDDPHVVVIDKPAGIMSVPYERGDRGTAQDLVREAWRRQGARPGPLFVVHRIDKDTSGLLAFAKTRRAEAALQALFRAHDVERTYLCVAHGDVPAQVIESSLVPDRGDGLRGSSHRGGKRAVTHVRPLERLGRFTLCEVRLETGRTHQIRIHLAEAGHALVGETVYIRDGVAGGVMASSPRLLLHAATLGFAHPVTIERLRFSSPLPPDFQAALRALA
jgi:23S rRNA pseudouridine1911/1915/1917 synthase